MSNKLFYVLTMLWRFFMCLCCYDFKETKTKKTKRLSLSGEIKSDMK